MANLKQLEAEVKSKEKAYSDHLATRPAADSKELAQWKETSEKLAREAGVARTALDNAEVMQNN
jgi:hypothetical protein